MVLRGIERGLGGFKRGWRGLKRSGGLFARINTAGGFSGLCIPGATLTSLFPGTSTPLAPRGWQRSRLPRAARRLLLPFHASRPPERIFKESRG